jgi:hypothetical protein
MQSVFVLQVVIKNLEQPLPVGEHCTDAVTGNVVTVVSGPFFRRPHTDVPRALV